MLVVDEIHKSSLVKENQHCQSTMAGMFAAMALAPVVSQLASQLLFGGQQGGKRRMSPLPGNSSMIGLPNHLPPPTCTCRYDTGPRDNSEVDDDDDVNL